VSPEPADASRPTGGPRILGLVEGDPATALSGVARRLLDALGTRLPVVGHVDYAPHELGRLALAAATFTPDRARWRGRFHTSLLAHRVLSHTLARRLRAGRPDFDLALQVHGWVAGQPRPYALYVDQTRLMAEMGWPAWMPLGGRERSQILELERRMYTEAAAILTMGVPARESLLREYGVDPRVITVVGGGLMFDALPAVSGPAREPVITFVGREFDRKGGPCLLAAFTLVREQIPEAELRLVGVRSAVGEAGVTCLGLVRGRGRMSEILRASRVFCLPSRYEPYGFAFAEAMAHGVPCVGTTVQSIPEILDHGRAGVLVAPEDPGALAVALVRLLTDDQLADTLGAAGRARVERSLLWEHVAARAAQALETAAG
jgi:glycosyltransferase involved in cell wall biosynthesis